MPQEMLKQKETGRFYYPEPELIHKPGMVKVMAELIDGEWVEVEEPSEAEEQEFQGSPDTSSERQVIETHIDPMGYGIVAVMRSPAGEENVLFSDIRAGLVWPTVSAPGYYVILGQYDQPASSGRRPLRFFAEGEDALLQALFQKLTDDGKKHNAAVIYGDRSQVNMPFLESFDLHIKENVMGRYRLLQAPFSENLQYGVNLIRQHAKERLLEISKSSILYNQLRSLNVEDLSEEGKFYAVNALRYVVCGYEKSVDPPPMRSRQVRPVRVRDSGGWV